jgi:hypothetical protein
MAITARGTTELGETGAFNPHVPFAHAFGT